MNPLNSCPRCGRPSSTGVKFCAGCGSNLSPASASGRGWKLFFGAFAVLIGVIWAAVIFTRPQPVAQFADSTQQQSLLSQGSATAPAQSAPSPSLALTSAQHLSEAKRALADGYKPNKDPRKALWGEVAAAKWHLRSIGPAATEYREAQELSKEVARRERQIELSKKKAEADEDSEGTVSASGDGDSGGASSASSSTTYSPPSDSTTTKQPLSPSTSGAGSSDEYYTNSKGARVHRPVYSESGPPAGATAQCRDGSYSFSQSRRGTCSHHGGVSRWL
jgi:hypothetical protein